MVAAIDFDYRELRVRVPSPLLLYLITKKRGGNFLNTYLINDDNSITHTVKEPVVEKTNCVDEIQFICSKKYNGYTMSEFDVVIEYILPISKTNRVIKLTLADSNYKNNYLRYTLPTTQLTTSLTAEVGEVEMSISFMKAELDYDGNTIERVRYCSNTAKLNILPLTSWLKISDEGLSDLTAMYLENKKTAIALSELANVLSATKADGIKLTDDFIALTSNGETVGEEIPLETLNEKLVNVGGETTGNVKFIEI